MVDACLNKQKFETLTMNFPAVFFTQFQCRRRVFFFKFDLQLNINLLLRLMMIHFSDLLIEFMQFCFREEGSIFFKDVHKVEVRLKIR